MNIQLAVVGLTYIIILVMAFACVIFVSVEEEKSVMIIDKAFNNAFSILAFGLLVVYSLFILPPITLDYQTTSYLILASKFLSILTLGISLCVFYKKYHES
jgi:hypothetical protein